MNNDKFQETVCAVVVTYNRKNLLLECLEALRKQTRLIQGIYVIDNASTDGTSELLVEKGYISELPPEKLTESWEKEFEITNLVNGEKIKFYYVRMHENTGGAGGFHEGAKRAYEKGYDWLWLMDDDSEPKSDCLLKMFQYLLQYNSSKVITPLKISPESKVLCQHRGIVNYERLFKKVVIPINPDLILNFTEITHTSFVGPLIPRKIVSRIGFPNREFFIYYDDVEYSIRVTKENKIILISNSHIVHKEVDFRDSIRAKFLWKTSLTPRVDIKSFWKVYYSIRNLTYLAKKYQLNKLKFFYDFTLGMIKTMIGIVLYDNYKFVRISLILKAMHDGLLGKLGASIKPKEWIGRFSK